MVRHVVPWFGQAKPAAFAGPLIDGFQSFEGGLLAAAQKMPGDWVAEQGLHTPCAFSRLHRKFSPSDGAPNSSSSARRMAFVTAWSDIPSARPAAACCIFGPRGSLHR